MEQGFSKTAAVVGRGPSSAETDAAMVKFMLTELTTLEVDQIIKKSRALYHQCAPGQAIILIMPQVEDLKQFLASNVRGPASPVIPNDGPGRAFNSPAMPGTLRGAGLSRAVLTNDGLSNTSLHFTSLHFTSLHFEI